MNKKYTVFVSSTYEDLKEERQEVMQALLEMDCIPCGMELFPASNDEQFEFIKSIIDDCDYYILILAGRYGSLNKDGISYTELEFNYALQKNIPILSFIHNNINDISSGKCETVTSSKKKLQAFRKLVEKKLCKYWTTKEQLSGIVSRSMLQLIKKSPAIGWVRANQVSNEETLTKLVKLHEENKNLIDNMNSSNSTEKLSQGNETTNIVYNIYNIGETDFPIDTFSINTTWNDLLKIIGPGLIEEEPKYLICKTLVQFATKQYFKILKSSEKISKFKKEQFMKISQQSIEEILIQFIALKYIQIQYPNHNNEYNISYESTYKLTELGKNIVLQLTAKMSIL